MAVRREAIAEVPRDRIGKDLEVVTGQGFGDGIGHRRRRRRLEGQVLGHYRRTGSSHLAAAAELARAAGTGLGGAIEAGSMSALLMMVAAGLGIGSAPGCVAHLRQPGVVLRPSDPTAPEVPLVAAWRAGREVPGAEALVAACRRTAVAARRTVEEGSPRRA